MLKGKKKIKSVLCKRILVFSLWSLVFGLCFLPNGYSGHIMAEDMVDNNEAQAQLGQEFSEEDLEIIENLELLQSLEFLGEDTALLDNYEVINQWDETKNVVKDEGEAHAE